MQFKLLLKNPELEKYNYQSFSNKYINQTMGYEFGIPKPNKQPFILSCFALSVDGKILYPDIPSGFSIASCNSHASQDERSADLFTLMFARTISDAVIMGTTSINDESGNYTPEIVIPELKNIRDKQQLSPTALIICRDLTNIDFSHKVFANDMYQLIICCINTAVDLNKLPTNYKQIKFDNWLGKHELAIKNLVIASSLSSLVAKLYQVGFKTILNESPYFHHELIQLKLLNELWLNYSGSYIGGNMKCLGGAQNAFNSKNHPDCKLLTLHSLGYNFLYTRQKMLYPD